MPYDFFKGSIQNLDPQLMYSFLGTFKNKYLTYQLIYCSSFGILDEIFCQGGVGIQEK